MKNQLILLLLLTLLSPTLAESAEDFFKMSRAFDKVVESAESADQLFPHLTTSSVKKLKSMDKEMKVKALSYLQVAVALAPEGIKVMESKIGSEQAAISIGAEEDGMSVTREVEFRKEEGRWKVDLGAYLDHLE